MWRWLLSSFFVPSRFIRVCLEFTFTFLDFAAKPEQLFYDHFLPPPAIWMNGDVTVAPLVFCPFLVGFSYIRVSLEFAFTFLYTVRDTHMTYYSMIFI